MGHTVPRIRSNLMFKQKIMFCGYVRTVRIKYEPNIFLLILQVENPIERWSIFLFSLLRCPPASHFLCLLTNSLFITFAVCDLLFECKRRAHTHTSLHERLVCLQCEKQCESWVERERDGNVCEKLGAERLKD